MEYERIKKAVEALEDAYRAVFAAARVGMTATEIDAILSERLEDYGAELPVGKTGNTPFVVDEGGVPPKLRKNRIPLEKDKLWAMDNSICLDGYWADLGRYGWFGAPPEKLVKAYQRVVDRQDEVAAAIRPGVSMDEIFLSIPDGLDFEVHRIGKEPNMLPNCGKLIPDVPKRPRNFVS